MILSWFERKDSPFLRIQYAGARGEPKQYLKTAVRKDDPRRREKIAREIRRVEAQLIAADVDRSGHGDWLWVPAYLRTRYASKAATQRQYKMRWRWMADYLDEMEIENPGSLTREDVFGYVEWRTSQVKEKSRKQPAHNTALGELKLLGLVMDEAVTRKLATENPARKLGIEREETDPTPEIVPAERAIIRAALAKLPKEAEWMRVSFELAINTGLRFATTQIARHQVRLESGDILIERPKGGRKREFSIPIYPSIQPLIDEFVASKRALTWTAPTGTLTGLAWSKFLGALNLSPGVCFHSTRVTFITEGMRAGVPESVMMKMVNHAQKEISRIYQRWTPDDVRRYAGQVPSL